jgi:ring-1,2-phenylacetyl-CoA epoxidase subunit PaaC
MSQHLKSTNLNNTKTEYLLRLADNGLILSHRLSQWAGHGPVLEEDIALSNIALDLLGQARLIYQHVASIEGRGEDDYAYFRDSTEFRNFTMLELPNSGVASAGHADGDYAFTIARNALYSGWALLNWQALANSSEPQLAAIAAKAVKETRYHWRHSSDWLLRLGDGTAESHDRMQQALDSLVPYTNEWFRGDAIDQQAHAAGLGIDPVSLLEPWLAMLKPAVAEATLLWPKPSQFVSRGKQGQHGEHLSYLLTEMQSLARQHPGAQW